MSCHISFWQLLEVGAAEMYMYVCMYECHHNTTIRYTTCRPTSSCSIAPHRCAERSPAHLQFEIPGGQIRVINFALHHFTPNLASGVIADVVRSRSAILIGDLSPNPGGLLWNWLLALKYGVQDVLTNGLSPVDDLWVAPLLPLLPLMACWDATVSVLRAYSTAEILEMIDSHTQQEEKDTDTTCLYDIDTWSSSSYADWIGMPGALAAGLHHLGLRPYDPVMQFVFARPRIIESS